MRRGTSHSAPDFANVATSSDLASAFVERRDAVASRIAELGGVEMMTSYTEVTDALVNRVLDLAIDEALGDSAAARRQAARQIAIAAVGGYGRREMSPFSDVDVAFLVATDEDESTALVVKRAFRMLMDVLDTTTVKVGYSYRRVDDVENLPLETQTALLDARCVAGSRELFADFRAALRSAIVPCAFVVDHVRVRGGVGFAGDTAFVVEPNIKEGYGGLRDLHAARWTAEIAFGVSGEGVWDGLRARGILLDSEVVEIRRAIEFMSRARNVLHLRAGRVQDTLAAGRQAEVAEAMGFEGVADFISRYYAHAHRLRRIYHKVADACLQESLPIEPGVVARDGRLCILDRGLFSRDRAALLRVFRHAQVFGLKVDREAGDLIGQSVRGYKITPEASRTFLDLLSRAGAAASLRSMAELGVLQALIPQFGELMYKLPGDAAHCYTVGEHCLRTVDNLEALLADTNERFADISSRVQHFEVLFIAALLHDIGKLDSKRDHAKTGAFRAAKFARQLGMPEDACAKVEFLVRHHLKMSETARLRDLHQHKTIRDFTATVGDTQLLDMLLLLTVADSRAVGTRNWSEVQVRFLLELHERASAAIRSPDSAGADLERHRKRVSRELCLANLPAAEVDEHCAAMPAAYLLNTPPEELAAHIGYVKSVQDGSPVVELKDDRAGQFTQLTVVALDRPGLLSDIAGVLHAVSVDIHAAQIFTRCGADDVAIDILYIDHEGRQLTEMKKWQLEGELTSMLTGQVTVDEELRRWNRKALTRISNLTISAPQNLSDHQTVLDIRADDAPGLLHCLTHRISEKGLLIHSARVATWGHEAHDAFYVTARDGSRLSATDIAHLEAALCGEEPLSR